MIAFACPRCGVQVQRHDNQAGVPTSCDGCGQHLTVPSTNVDAAVHVLAAADSLPDDDLKAKRLTASPAETGRLRFACPHCKAGIKADPAKAGLRVKCPKCSLPIEVPLPKGKLLDDIRPSLAHGPASIASQAPEHAASRPESQRYSAPPFVRTSRLVGLVCVVGVLLCISATGLYFARREPSRPDLPRAGVFTEAENHQPIPPAVSDRKARMEQLEAEFNQLGEECRQIDQQSKDLFDKKKYRQAALSWDRCAKIAEKMASASDAIADLTFDDNQRSRSREIAAVYRRMARETRDFTDKLRREHP